MIPNNPDSKRFKWCTWGKHFELRTQFYSNRSRSDGLANYCINCSQARSKEYHHTVRRLQRFGVTAEMFDQMLADQEGKCATCKQPFQETACLDHDHSTQEPRGLLCDKCNRALGLVEDDPEILGGMIQYLLNKGARRHPNQSSTRP